MSTIFIILITALLISLISFVGIFTLFCKEEFLNKILILLVALSAGTLMGGAFFHLLPEAVEESQGADMFSFVLIGFVLFFIIEKGIHWHHCHKGFPHAHTFHYMNLIGDSIHNFIDGLIMSASFVVSIPLGIATSIAIAAHEIPQEIGDFGVLIYGGFDKKQALLLNFIAASTVILGGIVGYYIVQIVDKATQFLLPFAAGGFIYIAATDLIPELKKEEDIKRSIIVLQVFIIGLQIMWIFTLLFHHSHVH